MTTRRLDRGRTTKRRGKTLSVLGWREWLALPDLGVARIKAKIDSGARTSSIHAFNVRAFSDGGVAYVSFVIHIQQRRRRPTVECVAEIKDQRKVRSSSGHQEERYVIETTVDLAGLSWPIELTLADRDEMGFRMLLGREAIRNRFLIDPNRSFLAGRGQADVIYRRTRKEN